MPIHERIFNLTNTEEYEKALRWFESLMEAPSYVEMGMRFDQGLPEARLVKRMLYNAACSF